MMSIHLSMMKEGVGGLFDFNATLPLIAIQVIFLMVVLNIVFFRTTNKLLSYRLITPSPFVKKYGKILMYFKNNAIINFDCSFRKENSRLYIKEIVFKKRLKRIN